MVNFRTLADKIVARREEVGKTQPTCPKCGNSNKQVQLLCCWLHTDTTDWRCRNLACGHYFSLEVPRSSATRKTSSDPAAALSPKDQ